MTPATKAPARRAGASEISPAGLAFIARFEGFIAKPYNDAAGHATVGYGHLLHKGPVTKIDELRYAKGMTQAAALELLRLDAAKAEQAVRELVTVPLTQGQLDALVSFAFNCGTGSLRTSTLLKRLNAKAYAEVPAQLLRWNRAGGQELAGLTRRRQAEIDELWNAGGR